MDRMILTRHTPIGEKSLSPSKFTNKISAWMKRENKGGKIMVPWLVRRARPPENNVNPRSPPQDEEDEMAELSTDMDSASSLRIAEMTQSHVGHRWSYTPRTAFNGFEQYQTWISNPYLHQTEPHRILRSDWHSATPRGPYSRCQLRAARDNQTRVSSVYSTEYHPRAKLLAHATNSIGVESIYAPWRPFILTQENMNP